MLTDDCHCRPPVGVVHTNVMRWFILAAIFMLPAAGLAQAPPAAGDAPSEPSMVAGKTMGVLVLTVGVDGVPVSIDGETIGTSPLPGPWTLPAGEHKLELLPPGKPPEVLRFTITAGQSTVLEVMGKAKAPAPADAVSAKAAPKVVKTGPGFSLSMAGYITAGVGVLAIGGGVAMGLAADSAASDARDLKANGQQNTRSAFESKLDEADESAFLANLGYGIGGVALVAGATMVFLASDGPFGGSAGILISPTPGGAVVSGRF